MIHLAPDQVVEPQYGYIPYQRALRWYSIHDEVVESMPLQVFITQAAFLRVCADAQSDLNNETGGWLLGKRRKDQGSDQRYIVIEKILPAPYTRRGRVFLTFTQDSQVTMYDSLEQDFSGKELLGWYHTHPGMGIFLSRYDLWLHEHFFPEAWKVALVIEPHKNVGGFFIPSRDGELDPYQYSGFFELNNHSNHSVVNWNNLKALPILAGGTGACDGGANYE